MLSADEDEPTILGGPARFEPATLVLRWVLGHGGELFLRYAMAAGG